MILEIHDRSASPYAWAVMIIATYPNGMSTRGSGALVGRNDILTAAHVVYDPDYGGWASELAFYPGVDFNSVTDRFESDALVNLEGAGWRALAWPDQVFVDDDHQTLTRSESEYDIALIGLTEAVGNRLGWFGLAGGYDDAQWAHQLGYPLGTTGLMHGDAWVEREQNRTIYSAESGSGTDIMAAGSSGGPLYVIDERAGAVIIGVKSSGGSTSSHWADIGRVYDQLVEEMASNDELLAASVVIHRGTAGDDLFAISSVSERFEGGAGTDLLLFSGARAQFMLTFVDGEVMARNQLDSSDIDEVSEIERLQFTDGILALDVGLGQTAGQAYRLYQAAFARQPDNDGLGYWIGDIDAGASIQQVAAGFLQSAEFALLYGDEPATRHYLTLLYANVLGREPDAAGYDYWTAQLADGMTRAGALVSFAESEENYQNTIGLIGDGLWLI